MNMLWVAFNDYGDLVATSYTISGLLDAVWRAGYYEDEVLIGRVTA